MTKLNFEEDDVTAPLEIEITKIHETTEYTVEILVHEFLILLPLNQLTLC